ncbi:MAG: 2Fe-2S iron-sulfur cluster-binding protein [Bdellovibrionales bacterium]
MPKCTINGKEVVVKDGATIMEAFSQLKEDIAYYCWHPGLSVAGVCRMCMVEVEGNPKLQIACNTPVVEGMKVTNKTEKVKESVKWTLDFHLINHPLDCPICDQAGECGLQEFYMTYGKYDPEMGEKKEKKHKVVDLGPTVVLDSERCILCSRCVRFTEEVTKTNELGIFNRGDHSEIGTFENRPLDNKYSVNTVDICPVGALTSKDFRFRQRVWYLKDFETTCNGCATGCAVKISHNQNGLFRVKPVYDEKVNGHWMCDEGRDVYKFVNLEARLRHAQGKNGQLSTREALEQAAQTLKKHGPQAIALLLTAQYTNEELSDITKYFTTELKSKNIFHWKNNEATFDTFDGLLIRGDKNPNTAGLQKVMKDSGAQGSLKDLMKLVEAGTIKAVVVAGPENLAVYPELDSVAKSLTKVSDVIWLSSCKSPGFAGFSYQIPMKSFAEKDGTFTNYAGEIRKVKRGVNFVPEAVSLSEAVHYMKGVPATTIAEVNA